MKNLDEIKKLMVAGDTVQADEALKELLEAEPNNLQAKMLYGTCRQLLGDEETFKRIHDELEPEMVKLADDPPTDDTVVPSPETMTLWRKYHALWVRLIVGGLVLAGGVLTVAYFGKIIVGQVNEATTAAYRGPEKPVLIRQRQLKDAPPEAIERNKRLYGGPRDYETEIIR